MSVNANSKAVLEHEDSGEGSKLFCLQRFDVRSSTQNSMPCSTKTPRAVPGAGSDRFFHARDKPTGADGPTGADACRQPGSTAPFFLAMSVPKSSSRQACVFRYPLQFVQTLR